MKEKEDAHERLADGSYVLIANSAGWPGLGASGKLNRHWDLFAHLTYLDGETHKIQHSARDGPWAIPRLVETPLGT